MFEASQAFLDKIPLISLLIISMPLGAGLIWLIPGHR